MRLAPHQMFMAALTLFALLVSCCVLLSTRAPWMGLSFEPDGDSFRVSAVAPESPADGQVTIGDRFIAIQSVSGISTPVAARYLLRNPDQISTYGEYRELLSGLSAIRDTLRTESVSLIRADGSQVQMHPGERTPLQSVSALFWLQVFCSAISYLVAASIWSFRPKSPTIRYLALSGAALMLTTLTAAVFSSRALGMDGELVEKLIVLNHFSSSLFIASFVGLCWIYPTHLPGRSFMPATFMLIAFFWWIGDLLQAWPSQDLGFRGFQIFGWVTVAILLAWQRLRLARQPHERLQLRWFASAVIGGSTLYLVLYPLPYLLTGEPWVEREIAAACLHMIYLLLAVGIYRHQLFHIDPWVWTVWALFGISTLLVLLDITIIYSLGLSSPRVVAASLAVLAWLYFPLRQWLWAKWSGGLQRRDYRAALPELSNELLALAGTHPPPEAWAELLKRVFAPLHWQSVTDSVAKVELRDGGTSLVVPAVAGAPAMCLSDADRGTRLFSAEDQRLTTGLVLIAGQIAQMKRAALTGADDERRRIATGLHDEVIPSLLSFIYHADDTQSAESGRSLIRELRRILQALETPRANAIPTSAHAGSV